MHHHHGWIERLDDPSRDDWQKPAAVIAAMELTADMTVADIGAGSGYFTAHLSRAAGRVLALDVQPSLIEHLRRRFPATNVEPRLVSPNDPALADASVDRVLIVDVWHHQNDRVKYAERLRRALKPGGRVLIVDGDGETPHSPPPQMRVTPAQVTDELVAAGFDVRVLEGLLPFQFVVSAHVR